MKKQLCPTPNHIYLHYPWLFMSHKADTLPTAPNDVTQYKIGAHLTHRRDKTNWRAWDAFLIVRKNHKVGTVIISTVSMVT